MDSGKYHQCLAKDDDGDHVDDHDHDCFDDDSDGDDGGDDGHDGKAKDDDTEDYDDNYKVHNSSNVGDIAKDQI